MQFPDNKVMDQVHFANSPLQQQTIDFSEVIGKLNIFSGYTILVFLSFHSFTTYMLPCHQVFIVPNYFLLPLAWEESRRVIRGKRRVGIYKEETQGLSKGK